MAKDTRVMPLTAVAITILDCLQLLAFFFSKSAGFPWLPATTSYLADFLSVLNVGSFLPFVDRATYEPIFYCSLVWVVFVLANFGYVIHSFGYDSTGSVLPLRTLRLTARLTTTVLFIPLFSVLLSVSDCSAASGGVWDCWSAKHIVATVISMTAALFLCLMSLCVASSFFEWDPTSSNLLAKPHGRVDVAFLLIKTAIVSMFALARSNGNQWVMTAFLLVVAKIMLWTWLAYLPLFDLRMCKLVNAYLSLLVWAGICLLMAQIHRSTGSGNDAAYAFYLGIPLVLALGWNFVSLRVQALLAMESPKSPYQAELKCRFMIVDALERVSSEREREDAIERAEQLLHLATEQFPNSPLPQLYLANFYATYQPRRHLELSHLTHAEQLDPALDLSTLIYRRSAQIRESVSSGKNMDVIRRLEFEKHERCANKLTLKTLRLQLSFWEELLRADPRLLELSKASTRLHEGQKGAEKHYAALIRLNDQSIPAMRAYARFMLDCAHDEVRGNAMLQAADDLEDSRSRVRTEVATSSISLLEYSRVPLDFMDDMNAVVQVSSAVNNLGTITAVNNRMCVMFGHKSIDIVGRNVSTLIPAPIDEMHDMLLQRYVETGNAVVVDSTRVVFALHARGHLFPAKLCVREVDVGRGLTLVGIFQAVQTRDDYVMFGEKADMFTLFGATPGSQAFMGIRGDDVKNRRLSIKDWLPDIEEVLENDKNSRNKIVGTTKLVCPLFQTPQMMDVSIQKLKLPPVGEAKRTSYLMILCWNVASMNGTDNSFGGVTPRSMSVRSPRRVSFRTASDNHHGKRTPRSGAAVRSQSGERRERALDRVRNTMTEDPRDRAILAAKLGSPLIHEIHSPELGTSDLDTTLSPPSSSSENGALSNKSVIDSKINEANSPGIAKQLLEGAMVAVDSDEEDNRVVSDNDSSEHDADAANNSDLPKYQRTAMKWSLSSVDTEMKVQVDSESEILEQKASSPHRSGNSDPWTQNADKTHLPFRSKVGDVSRTPRAADLEAYSVGRSSVSSRSSIFLSAARTRLKESNNVMGTKLLLLLRSMRSVCALMILVAVGVYVVQNMAFLSIKSSIAHIDESSQRAFFAQAAAYHTRSLTLIDEAIMPAGELGDSQKKLIESVKKLEDLHQYLFFESEEESLTNTDTRKKTYRNVFVDMMFDEEGKTVISKMNLADAGMLLASRGRLVYEESVAKSAGLPATNAQAKFVLVNSPIIVAAFENYTSLYLDQVFVTSKSVNNVLTMTVVVVLTTIVLLFLLLLVPSVWRAEKDKFDKLCLFLQVPLDAVQEMLTNCSAVLSIDHELGLDSDYETQDENEEDEVKVSARSPRVRRKRQDKFARNTRKIRFGRSSGVWTVLVWLSIPFLVMVAYFGGVYLWESTVAVNSVELSTFVRRSGTRELLSHRLHYEVRESVVNSDSKTRAVAWKASRVTMTELMRLETAIVFGDAELGLDAEHTRLEQVDTLHIHDACVLFKGEEETACRKLGNGVMTHGLHMAVQEYVQLGKIVSNRGSNGTAVKDGFDKGNMTEILSSEDYKLFRALDATFMGKGLKESGKLYERGAVQQVDVFLNGAGGAMAASLVAVAMFYRLYFLWFVKKLDNDIKCAKEMLLLLPYTVVLRCSRIADVLREAARSGGRK